MCPHLDRDQRRDSTTTARCSLSTLGALIARTSDRIRQKGSTVTLFPPPLPLRDGRSEEASALRLHEAPYSFGDPLVKPPEQDRSHHDGSVHAEAG